MNEESWCCGKARYANPQNAYFVFHKLTQKGRGHKRRPERGMYYCELCRGWHLTSKGVNASRAKKK